MDSAYSPSSSSPLPAHYTEPTTSYWQEILTQPTNPTRPIIRPPYQYNYPALLPDSRYLLLPIRALSQNPQHAVASLLVNQASMDVVETLADFLAEQVKPFNPEIIIGLPTLGLSLAPLVAGKLGLKRYIPLGYSRKFWYDDALSASVSSITSPEIGLKKVYLDPHLLPLVEGKRAVIIDDAVSSGTTLQVTWDLLEGEGIGCEIVGCGVVMKQGEKWKERIGVERTKKLVFVLESPLLEMVEEGWVVRS